MLALQICVIIQITLKALIFAGINFHEIVIYDHFREVMYPRN